MGALWLEEALAQDGPYLRSGAGEGAWGGEFCWPGRRAIWAGRRMLCLGGLQTRPRPSKDDGQTVAFLFGGSAAAYFLDLAGPRVWRRRRPCAHRRS